jgi:hypothetical protein
MTPTRHTDERFAIRALIDNRERGWSLAVSFFRGTPVTEADVFAVYAGLEIDDEKWATVKRVLRERMTRD